MLYTSYYAKYDELIKAGFKCIGITAYPPKWCNCGNINILAPPTWLLTRYKDGYYDWEVYKTQYLAHLDNNKLQIKEIISKIRHLDFDVVFLCYESPEKNCHRHILAEWLNNEYGSEIIKEVHYSNDKKD